MELDKLIDIASAAYYPEEPDLVSRCHKNSRGDGPVGDTLAEFIAIELSETFGSDQEGGDTHGQLAEAAHQMDRAAQQLRNVAAALVMAARAAEKRKSALAAPEGA